MIAAVVSSAAVTVIVAVIVFIQGSRLADAREQAATAKAQNAIDASTIATLTGQVAAEKERANALDGLLAQAEADSADPGSPGTALDRLLLSWKHARASQPTSGSSSGLLPQTPATASTGPDDVSSGPGSKG